MKPPVLAIAASEIRRYWLVFVGTVAVAIIVPLIANLVRPDETPTLPMMAIGIGAWALIALAGSAYGTIGSAIANHTISFDLTSPRKTSSPWAGRILAVVVIFLGNLSLASMVAHAPGGSEARSALGYYLLPLGLLLLAAGVHYGLTLRARHPFLLLDLTLLAALIFAISRAARRIQLARALDQELFFGILFSAIAAGLLAGSLVALVRGRSNLQITAKNAALAAALVYLTATLVVLGLHYLTTPRPHHMRAISPLGHGWIMATGYDPGRLGARARFLITPNGQTFETAYWKAVDQELAVAQIDGDWFVISADGERRQLRSVPTSGVRALALDSDARRLAVLTFTLQIVDIDADKVLETIEGPVPFRLHWTDAGLFAFDYDPEGVRSFHVNKDSSMLETQAELTLGKVRGITPLTDQLARISAGPFVNPTVVIWNFRTGEELIRSEGAPERSQHASYVDATVVGDHLVASGYGVIEVLNLNTREIRSHDVEDGFVGLGPAINSTEIIISLYRSSDDLITPHQLSLFDVTAGTSTPIEGEYLMRPRGDMIFMPGRERAQMIWSHERRQLVPLLD